MLALRVLILAAGCRLILAPGRAAAQEISLTPQERARILTHSPLPAPPPDPTNAVADNTDAATLGQMLFFDARLSSNGAVSCSTCHDPAKAFADGKSLAEGLARVQRHSPALWNAAYNRWLFWDGRADTLWSQATKPIEHPDEMGGSRLQTARLIAKDAALRAAYERVFAPLPDLSDTALFPVAARPVTDKPSDPQNAAWQRMAAADQEIANRLFTNACKAIEAYERRIVSRRAPFDVFVEGLRDDDTEKLAALSPAAQRGARIFVGKGNCRLCHIGPNFTDGEFHNVRVPPLEGGLPTDPGRFRGIEQLLADPFNAIGIFSDERSGVAAEKLRHLSRKPADAELFKTPSLRNVALTPPYMHQGQFDSLERVIRHYSTFDGALPPGHHQQEPFLKPINLSADESTDLLEFLRSLSDTAIDPALLKRPAETPAPKS
ncbi:MAG: cytochrome c peroxidase [Phycisphaerae bacterium]